jgi:hypothetical protein
MGIFDDFIKNIKAQREQYKAEREKAKEVKPPETAHGGGVIERMKEQRRQFEEAGKKGAPSVTRPTTTLQEGKAPAEAAIITRFNHTFRYIPGSPEHVWFDDATKSVYIDDPDAFVTSGGKIEVRGITGAMDQYMYDIYTSRGGPLGQAKYFRTENVIVSLVSDPFERYR